MIRKIVSGGQTGADRAALDFAMKNGISHGGWVPKGRKAEDGPIPDRYNLREMPTASYPQRTEQNILDSDGTLIISHGPLTGGSALTKELADRRHKPRLHIDLNAIPLPEAAEKIRNWLELLSIEVLNIAGPRASENEKIYSDTITLLEISI